jgi:glycogen debranching enzyme
MLPLEPSSPYLNLLKNRIDLEHIPFTERSSRILVFRREDRVFMRLSERWVKLEAERGHYRQRPPIISDLVFTDPSGQLLPTTVVTYPHLVVFTTPAGPFALTFFDTETLFISLPPGRVGVRFRAEGEKSSADRRGGTFKGARHIAYTTNAAVQANIITPESSLPGYFQVDLDLVAEEGDGLLLNVTPRLGFNRSMPDAAATLTAAERRWHEWFAEVPDVQEHLRDQYYYAWWIMRAGLLSTRFYTTREAMAPSKIHYVGVWQWDAYFHALAYRYVDKRLAQDQLRIVLDHQQPNGMIPDAVHDEGVITHLTLPVEADVTKPPLIAWAALKLYETDGDRDFLDEIYGPLVRWHHWWFQYNDFNDSGIVAYAHPFSSGLDDSPLWDAGMPVESPELNTYLYHQMEALARIAEIIGETADVPVWRERAAAHVQRMIRHFWDEEAGVFWVKKDNQPVRVLTPFNLYPLWTGKLPEAMVDRLVAHLTNPAELWPRWPLPTVALNDPSYDGQQMWRGPTWININYIFIEALVRANRADLARALRDRTLELILQHEDIWEYYNPETADHPPKAAPMFGWSAAAFIDLAIKAARGEVI